MRGAALATLVACLSCGHGAKESGGKPIVIGVSLLNLSSEFIVMLKDSMDAKAGELGVQLIVNDAQRDAATQVRQAENFIAQKVDAIILNPCEFEASSPAVDEARAAGIGIVNVNSETRTIPTAFVGSRDEESGRLAMEYIARRLGGRGNVLMMQGFMGQAAQIKRDQGAREVLAKNPGLKLLADQTAEWDRAKAMTLMENWIQSYGRRIDAVFAHNDEMAHRRGDRARAGEDERQSGCYGRRRNCRWARGGEERAAGRDCFSGRQRPGRHGSRDRSQNRAQASLHQRGFHPVSTGDQRKP
jgi:inositol transport system substrate-binding protein